MDAPSLLGAACLYSACVAGFLQLKWPRRPTAWRFPSLTLLVTAIIALTAMAQVVEPALLDLLKRDATAVAAGQWWRLLSALFVQDGGVAGSVFNLVGLLFVGTLAEQFWRRTHWLVLFFGGALLTELAALSRQPVGAGNSIADFSLAAGLSIGCLRQRAQRPVQAAASSSLVAGLVLVSLHDIHGLAAVFGAALALALRRPATT